MGCSPLGHKESGTTERLTVQSTEAGRPEGKEVTVSLQAVTWHE